MCVLLNVGTVNVCVLNVGTVNVLVLFLVGTVSV